MNRFFYKPTDILTDIQVFIVITHEHYALQKLYKLNAHSIMDKYHLISDEPRMKVALQAMKQLSNVSKH